MQQGAKPIDLKKTVQSNGLFFTVLGLAGNFFIYKQMLPSFPFTGDVFMWILFIFFFLASEASLLYGLKELVLPYNSDTAKYILQQEVCSTSADIQALFEEINEDLSHAKHVFGKQVIIGERWILVSHYVIKGENVKGIFTHTEPGRRGRSRVLTVCGYPSKQLLCRESEDNPHLIPAYQTLCSLFPHLPCGDAEALEQFTKQSSL